MPIGDLLEAAKAARGRAYAPYSGFRVGAAIRSASGGIHVGCNVENAAFPQSQCAEASAVGAMIAAGEQVIREVLVIGSGEGPCSPCGGCRQRLVEFGGPDTVVHMLGEGPEVLSRRLAELLPESFRLNASRPGASDAVAVIRARADFVPLVGLILGSGLGEVANAIEPVAIIPYPELPGFPRPRVAGHSGRLVLGQLAGVPVACLSGRVHLYEGHPASAVNLLVRTLRAIGCGTLVLTNASGSLRPDIHPGSIVALTDHINLTGHNPLVGINDEAIGPRFPEMADLYDARLRAIVRDAARAGDVPFAEGVYLGLLGPSFETPAEIRAFRVLGADLVGMSTVLEAISARHCGMRVVGLSIVTNLAAGLSAEALGHAGTLAVAARAAGHLQSLLSRALPEIARAAA